MGAERPSDDDPAPGRRERTSARRIVVSGRVQGVGYRESLVAIATRAGLVGWVRNRADGRVEAVVQGEHAAVEAALAWCRRGPAAARVQHVDDEIIDPDPGLRSFARRPTA